MSSKRDQPHPMQDMRVLFVVNRCKHIHFNYLRALAAHFPRNEVIISYLAAPGLERHPLSTEDELLPRINVLNHRAIPEDDHDLDVFQDAFETAVRRIEPDIVHFLPYLHDHLFLRAVRSLESGQRRPAFVYETRDPSGLLRAQAPDEEAALEAADGYIFVSHEMADYVFNRYWLEPAPCLIIRQSEWYSLRSGFEGKLSAEDGKTHISLLGTFVDDPNHYRHYEDLIKTFVASTTNTVLHAHSHQDMDYLRALDASLGERFFNHPTVPDVTLSDPSQNRYTATIGRYDFNLVAHDNWRAHSARELLRYCNPTKATSALVLADLPFLCTSHYRGIIELIDEFGCGYVFRGWSDLNRLFRQKERWSAMLEGARRAGKALCLEQQATRMPAFYRSALRSSRRASSTAGQSL